MKLDLDVLVQEVEIQIVRSSPKTKKSWRAENFRIPRETKVLLAAMKQETGVPMEDTVNHAILNIMRDYVKRGIIVGNPVTIRPRQLEMFAH